MSPRIDKCKTNEQQHTPAPIPTYWHTCTRQGNTITKTEIKNKQICCGQVAE